MAEIAGGGAINGTIWLEVGILVVTVVRVTVMVIILLLLPPLIVVGVAGKISTVIFGILGDGLVGRPRRRRAVGVAVKFRVIAGEFSGVSIVHVFTVKNLWDWKPNTL
nr:hypothetical protein Itr_chr07CG12350 [Ipomoea trifida]